MLYKPAYCQFICKLLSDFVVIFQLGNDVQNIEGNFENHRAAKLFTNVEKCVV